MTGRAGRPEIRNFRSIAATYGKYRLSYPDRLLERVAALAGLAPGDAVLDLGAGTGMLAVPFARMGMAVTAMDPEQAMLDAAGAAARRAGVSLTLVRGSSYDLTPDMGPFRLVTMGRSFHWMDRTATLAMLDRIVLPDGAVALFHDAHPPVAENAWFKVLHAAQERHGRRNDPAAQEGRDRRGGHRRYEPFLFASAFSQIEGLSVTIRQELEIDDIIGRGLSASRCAPEYMGARQAAFIAELTAQLRALSPGGRFIEVAELVAVLARRPAP